MELSQRPTPNAQRLRVLHFLDTEQFAGTEQHVMTLIKFLSRLGVECVLLCRAENAEFVAKARDLGMVEVVTASGNKRQIRWALRQAVEIHAPDIVHAHNGRTSLAASLLTGRLPKRVLTQHFVRPAHVDYRGIKGIFASALHRYVNSQMDAIVAVSEAARQAMIEREHVAPEKVTTIWNGIEPPTPNAERAKQVLHQFGVDDGKIFLTTARLATEKGYLLLLDAVCMVRRQLPESRFVWIGAGVLEKKLQQEIRERGLERTITLLGYQDNASDFLAVADAFVLPSICEPFGLVLLEAMMCGVPVVATDCGGAAEIVAPAHKENHHTENAVGWLARAGNATSLSRMLLDIAQQPDGGKAEAERARTRALTEFTAERMAQQTLELYVRTLA